MDVGNDYLDYVGELANRKDLSLSTLKPKGYKDVSFIGQEAGVNSKIGLDLKDELKLRVNLETLDDALYVGSLYLGAPHGQKTRVIFDTGSEHLAVTGALCNN